MKNLLYAILALALAFSTPLLITSCGTTGSSVVTGAQAWLSDPKNQALIAQIAGTLIMTLAAKPNADKSAEVGKLAHQYPDVPAGALAAIAADPHHYAKH